MQSSVETKFRQILGSTNNTQSYDYCCNSSKYSIETYHRVRCYTPFIHSINI